MLIAFHGWPDLMGGPEVWQKIGEPVQRFGWGEYVQWVGLGLASLQFVGGVFLVLGLYTRTISVCLTLVMATAAVFRFLNGESFNAMLYPIEMGIVFLSLAFIGAGRFSIDMALFKRA
jgi:putative oxidoreductase